LTLSSRDLKRNSSLGQQEKPVQKAGFFCSFGVEANLDLCFGILVALVEIHQEH
jgi:hypothetical protein